MQAIAQSGDEHTSYYWNLATPTDDCPNWIARWFLYHKFRYRDGRNRNASKTDDTTPSHHHHSSRHLHRGHSSPSAQDSSGYYPAATSNYPTGSMTSGVYLVLSIHTPLHISNTSPSYNSTNPKMLMTRIINGISSSNATCSLFVLSWREDFSTQSSHLTAGRFECSSIQLCNGWVMHRCQY